MLTKGQTKIWNFILDYVSKFSISPTISEITLGLGLKSRSAVHRAVQAIEEEGLIRLVPNKRRNIEIIDEDEYMLPLVGKIAAGQPIEAIEEKETVNINSLFIGKNRYLLRVSGDSMIGDNICDGDYIVCEQCNTARDGTIVVALIDNQEATLKRIFRNQNGTVTLVPSNPELSPMVYPAERVIIQGMFIGLFRVALESGFIG